VIRAQSKNEHRVGRRIGAVQRKVLLLLLGGFALSCTRSPKTQWRIIKEVGEEWKEIGKQAAEQSINALYESKLLTSENNPDGSTTLTLTDNGKKRALTYQSHTMKIERSKVWDKKWRVVLSDIPEEKREARDALRDHLHYMGFYGLQKSVSVHPFDCKNQIDFLIELHDVRPYVRFMVADSIDNEADLKRFFNLK